MELLYNPDAMPEAELQATFVGRESLLSELLELVRSQPDGAGVQHAVIIAPRGMGKTSVLQKLRYEVERSDLAEVWLPLKFPEELYGVADLADFWLETLRLLSIEASDPQLLKTSQTLPGRFSNRPDIGAAALSLLRDFSRQRGKRLLLLVENLDMLFEVIADEHDNARLRDALMNDGTVMLVGSAVKFFKQARAYNQPLYNFFRIFDLNALTLEQSRQLLSRRGEQDGMPGFDDFLQANTARLRALHHFTQGIPRMVLMLYRVLAQSDMAQVREALEKLLDEVTPYYKARIEMLPVQQRKLLEHIARAAATTHEGVSPTELAASVHLPVNQVSAQLRRLVAAGYLRTAPLRGRSTCYLLSEPLYALWHQMRLNPETRTRKLVWLINFLQAWYDDRERVEEAQCLFRHYEENERAGDGTRALAVVEHLNLLAQSALPTPVAGDVQRLATRSLLRLRYEKLVTDDKANLSESLVGHQLADIEAVLARNPKDVGCWVAKGMILHKRLAYESAMDCISRALELDPNDAYAWFYHANLLNDLSRPREALTSYDRALELDSNSAVAWSNRGFTLRILGHFAESLASYNHALRLDSNFNWARAKRAQLICDIEDSILGAIAQDKLETACEIWGILDPTDDKEIINQIIKRAVLFAAELGYLTLARELIDDASQSDELFPLDRALAYLKSRDKVLIEKLSSGVKEAVQVVIDDLDTSIKRSSVSKSHPWTRVRLALDDKYIAKRLHLIHKLKGKDSTGRWTYYFVLVPKFIEEAFLSALESDETIELEDYGRVIASNYGEEPDQKTKTLLQKKYGFSV